MSKIKLLILGLIVSACLNAFLLAERSSQKLRLAEVSDQLVQARKDADSEKLAWTKLYQECIDENNVLVQKMKDVITATEGMPSK
jgi:hypothetical protein